MSGARRWGFHRLSRRWADHLAQAADIRAGQLVIDLGAGDGVLTLAAAERGARVIAVELHPARLMALRAATAGKNVTVVARDLDTFLAPTRPFRVLANPPFGLATATVRGITVRGSGLQRADLVLPTPLARRWVSTGVRGYRCALGVRVPRSAFSPAATGDGTVLILRRR